MTAFDKAWGVSKTDYELHAQLYKYEQFKSGVETALESLDSGDVESASSTLRMALQSLGGY
tara:strand:+ start:244 stop:426 length:183 start_codon:yes stop_codon:yes gene_type:complete